MRRSMLADAFEHHVWATLALIDACRSLTPAQLDSSTPGTYGSILQTIRHLVGGDASYLWVLTGGRVGQIEEDALDLAQLRDVMAANGAAWASLAAKDLDPTEVVVRRRDDGIDSHAPRGVRIAQALHHGTDHRSQVCTVLTTLGIQPPEIDVWAFAHAGGRIKEVQRTS